MPEVQRGTLIERRLHSLEVTFEPDTLKSHRQALRLKNSCGTCLSVIAGLVVAMNFLSVYDADFASSPHPLMGVV